MKKHLQPLTPAALYARVSSDRQDVDLSVSAHQTGQNQEPSLSGLNSDGNVRYSWAVDPDPGVGNQIQQPILGFELPLVD